MVGTDGHMSAEMLLIKHAKRRKLPLPYKGYGLEVDVYAAGMVLAQLLFGVSENDVADLSDTTNTHQHTHTHTCKACNRVARMALARLLLTCLFLSCLRFVASACVSLALGCLSGTIWMPKATRS